MKKRSEVSSTKKVKWDTFPKFIVTLVVGHGMLLTTASYVLAFFERDPVVDVSSTIVREIVAPVIVYLASNTILNVFEKNKLAFSVPLDAEVYKQGNPYGEKGKDHELDC